MFNFIPILFALSMSSIDAFILTGLKNYYLGEKWSMIIPISMLIYSIQPLIFFKSLSFETMTVMNILWDIMSDFMVTIIGVFYFKEKISNIKKLALFFSFVSILLFSYSEIENL